MFDAILFVIKRAFIAGTPLLLGTIGEVITERSGILNLGIEGMMSIGAVSGFIVTCTTGNPWLGLLAAVLFGILFSGIHAFASIHLQVNQVVSGLALAMLGIGISELWGKPFIGKSLEIKMQPIKIPLLGDIPLIGDIFFHHDIFFYLAIMIGFISWFLLSYTKTGIEIRSTGENPRAAEAQGVNIYLLKYLCVLTGGALAGMAGAHVSISYSTSWIEGIAGGRGWIVIALTVFSLWNPLRAFLGAFLFGGIFVLQYLLQPLGISPSFLKMLPYLTTIIVLLIEGFGKKITHSPAMLGEPYSGKED
jgi:ABC-type uncharacterized transport system permease subunit